MNAHPSQQITAVYCATCRKVCPFDGVSEDADAITFALTCGHLATLQPGAACGLDVRADAIIVYPNRGDLPQRRTRA